MTRVFYRVKQFIATRNAKLSYLEIDFIRKYLNHQEQILFFRMKGFDQKHALLVAQKCLERIRDLEWVNASKMVRASLLHDIGKSSANIGLGYRIFYVILNNIREGKLLSKLAKKNSRIPFKKKLFILKDHGYVGAKLLQEIGCNDNEVLQVVANHHQKPQVNESKMLPILRDIDSAL